MLTSENTRRSFKGTRSAEGRPPAFEPVSRGEPIGVLNIPRLGVSAVVAEGDDAGTLKVGIGHLPDTPMPWRDGNSALAAHRDTFFRPLKDVRVGDELYLTTPGHRELRYLVRETMVVRPDDLWVLDPTRVPTLTLITCYPFYFVGDAPQRFVVRAERVRPEAGARPESAVRTFGKQVAGAVSN